eukprot:Skav217204  [mRNA]  locus=scaffold3544:98164:102639:+ [translate_table: standard]
MPVKPSRISVPEQAGILDPLEHLSPDLQAQFRSMPETIPLQGPVPGDCRACHHVDPSDWPMLLKKLHEADMISFVPAEEALQEDGQVIKGGLFCVPHKQDSDRLINDRRPLNLREKRLGWCQLPSGVLLTQIILEDHQSIRASGDDLSNYFYLIKHLDAWLPRNCFGRSIKGKQLPGLGLEPDRRYYPAFRVVCMGDTNGVDIAQATHEGVLRSAGCLSPDQTLVYGKLLPPSDTLEGLYIDDHLVFQIVDKKPLRSREAYPDEALIDKSRNRYSELGLPRSEKKAFQKEYTFKAWGTEVCSDTGRVGCPLAKLRQLETLTCQLLMHRFATKKSLQKLLGLFVHPFMHRRECMSIFHHTYLHIDSMPEGIAKRLPQHVTDELITAVLLLPFASANMRLPVSVRVSATDASLAGGGRASTITAKSRHTRLDWTDRELPPQSSMVQAPDTLVDTFMKHHWVSTQSCKFQLKEHINLLELRMLHEEIKDRVNSGLSASAAFRLSRFSKQYRRRLFRGLRDLEEYLSQRRDCSLSSLLSDTGRAEEHLAQYVLCRHEQTEGASLLIVKHALLCCQHVQPRLKGRIQTAWENLRVWEEQRVCRLRPPLPVPLWLFLVGLARAHSVVETVAAISYRWKVLATFIEVGLLAMLRPGELLKLRHADISLPGEFTFSQPFAALRIASPKNRRQFGVEQFVVLRNPCTIQRLRELLIENSTSFLWTDSQARFSQMFKQLCNELHLSDCRFTPASLRPGGATLYYGMGIPISTLRFMGRWTVEKSLEHYIQLAMSSQIMNRLAPLVTCRLKKVGPMRVVAGGAFKGACFEDLSHDQLVKASKRYPGDPRLQKYAKAVVASAELDEGEPEPCLPIAVRSSAKESFRSKCCGFVFARALGHMSLRRSVVMLFLVMALILAVRPSLATACTKLLVRVMRVAIRRICGFFLLIFEGLLDELIYQIEFSVRQALPHNLDWEQVTHDPLSLFSHLVAALGGASISLLTTYIQIRTRRIPALD